MARTKDQSTVDLQDQSEALVEASYLAGFAMVADEANATVDDAPDDIIARQAVNPWHMGRRPARKRWAKDAIEAFARRLDEVGARPRPLTKTALVVWQPQPQSTSWLSTLAQTARSYTPRLALPFTRHTSA